MIRVLFTRVVFDKIKQYKRMDLEFRPNKHDVITWQTKSDHVIPTRVYSIEIVTPQTHLKSKYDEVDIIAYTE